MALLFVHGVNTRTERLSADVEAYVERYLAGPSFGGRPKVVYSYWGELGGRYRFGGRSRPRTRIAGQGLGDTVGPSIAGDIELPPAAPARAPIAPTNQPGITGGMSSRPDHAEPRLKDLGRVEAVAQLMRSAEEALADNPVTRRDTLAALTLLAEDDRAWRHIESAPDLDAELEVVATLVKANTPPSTITAQGSGWLGRFRDTAEENLRRAAAAPALALTTGLSELRPKLDGLLEQFVGDIFTYLDTRLPEPSPPAAPSDFVAGEEVWATLASVAGPIPRQVIADLLRCRELGDDDEALVVLSHSMGGQIMYEIFATFLPRLADRLAESGIAYTLPTVDLWCASASQVGLFEELSMFLGSGREPRHPAPFPGMYLRNWWNVWDYSDLLSFTAAGIVEDVDDGEFVSGRGFVGAHSGYLERPSFYKRLAAKIDEAMA